MTDSGDRTPPADGPPPSDEPAAVDDVPTVHCSRCDRSWDLERELEQVGTQAVQQFALDHERHTGHFPDEVTPWRADCRHCPDCAQRLEESAARRWAETHARHTDHAVDLRGPADEPARIDP